MNDRKSLIFGFQTTEITAAMTGVEQARALATTLGGAFYTVSGAIDAVGNFTPFTLAQAAQLASTSSAQALLVSNPANWSIEDSPIVNTQATVTRVASVAQFGVNVCTGFSFTLNAVAAITVPLIVNLRDGASGAGTVLWSGRFTAPAGTTVFVERTGLNILGSPDTEMTFEFAAVPGAVNFENVTLQGYTSA